MKQKVPLVKRNKYDYLILYRGAKRKNKLYQDAIKVKETLDKYTQNNYFYVLTCTIGKIKVKE